MCQIFINPSNPNDEPPAPVITNGTEGGALDDFGLLLVLVWGQSFLVVVGSKRTPVELQDRVSSVVVPH